MTIDLTIIPADRLAMLDTATLFHGSHDGGGDPDCKHCARELLHEIVTGKHADKIPPGCTVLVNILPRLNDGPWRDDAHRTAVMRPYLRKFLALDPANDQQRIYAIIDHVYRTALPSVCDALKLDTYGSALRNLAPIVDNATMQAGRDLWAGMLSSVKNKAISTARLLTKGASGAEGRAEDPSAVFDVFDVTDWAAAAYDAASWIGAAGATAILDAAYVAYDAAGWLGLCDRCPEVRQEAWAKAVTTILDRICAIL